MTPVLPAPLFGRPVRALHCIGVGGMGMAPLAIYLAQSGYAVTGEDDALSEAVAPHLVAAGVRVGPSGVVPPAAGMVVYSSAIQAQHPAYAAAAARALPLVRRGEMLAEVLREKKLIAVVGSHGKTTTTGMLITALRGAGFPCGYLLGGIFNDPGLPPAAAGPGDWVVAEVDESDGTIDRFAPEITLAVNLDWDHPDHYRSLSDLEAAFAALFTRTRKAIFINPQCGLSLKTAGAARAIATCTFGPMGHYRSAMVEEDAGGLNLQLGGGFGSQEARVRAHGGFNAVNATAALAVAHFVGAPLSPGLLAGYPGVKRRQTVLYAERGLTIIEDYAHHPAEIRALLTGLRHQRPGRMAVVFQPHRYSRTAQFRAEFAWALGLADELFLLDVYPAGEAPVPGGATADLYAELRRNGAPVPVTYFPGRGHAFLREVRAALRPGDQLLFVGAGDLDEAAHALVATLAEEARRQEAFQIFVADVQPRLSAHTRIMGNEPLAPKTTLRVGGPAQGYAEPAGEDDLRTLLRGACAHGVPVHLLGRGSNLLVPDEGVAGLVLALAHPFWQRFEPLPDGRVRVGAGLRLKNLCGLAGQAGWRGFEFLEGIPGTVGGALRMNAGAMGGWIFDVVEELTLMSPAGERHTLTRLQVHVGYRECGELREAIALDAVLRPVARADAAEISRLLGDYAQKRRESQPREPSAGCIFKNPPGDSAGRIIDQLGLKGERVGDAEISPVHANFIINRGRATSADVLALMRRVRAKVKATRGIELEPEVMLYGKTWKGEL
jgi:UDP-N-acetylmuramate--L-alanine ligase/UDP-N-acetylenolpyruvoylglucosamine reductase